MFFICSETSLFESNTVWKEVLENQITMTYVILEWVYMLMTNQQMKMGTVKNQSNHITHSMQPLPIVMLLRRFFWLFVGTQCRPLFYNELIWGEFKVQISYQISDSRNELHMLYKLEKK